MRAERYKLILTLSHGQDKPVEFYYIQQVLIDTGATQKEIQRSTANAERAYAAWRHPQELELYDLSIGPYELNNLANDAAYENSEDHLFTVLRSWQKNSRDPLANPAKLALLKAEDRAVQQTTGGHRQDHFSWQYVHHLYGSKNLQ